MADPQASGVLRFSLDNHALLDAEGGDGSPASPIGLSHVNNAGHAPAPNA